MRVVTTFHQPSSVTSSLKCTLARNCPNGHLVVAKSNRLEVSSIHPEGLESECSLEIWGRVLSIRAVASENADVSNILVLTDHPDPKLILLSYEVHPSGPSLVSKWSTSLYDRSARHAEYVNDVVVHPKGKIAVVSCYIGKLRVVCFKKGEVQKEFDVQIPELNLMSLSFLHTQPKAHVYTLALVHLDFKQRIQLLARELDIDSFDLSSEPSYSLPFTILSATHFPDTENPLQLIPVPSFDVIAEGNESDEEYEEPKTSRCRGGVVVLGGKRIAFYEVADKKAKEEMRRKDKRQAARRGSGASQGSRAEEKDAARENKKIKPRAAVKWPWSEVTTWCPADAEGRRFLIGDNFGRISMLVLDEAADLVLVPLGNASQPTTLSYLSSQVFYLGSHCGDSQLIRISTQPLSDYDSDTLPIPSGFKTVTPGQLSGARAGDGDYDMEDAEKGSGKGGKVVQCKGSFLEVLDQYQNIAPIADAVLADPEESGQPQIVTCSGSANTGSLNIVRTGADFQELAVLKEVPGIINVWPIRRHFQDSEDAWILATTVHESYLFRFDGRDSVTRVEGGALGLITKSRTLAIANVPKRIPQGGASTYVDSSLIVQVTPEGVNLVEYDDTLDTFTRVGSGWSLRHQDNPVWKDREIVAAYINPSQFVVALSRGAVVVLNLKDGQLNRTQAKEFFGKEISAVSCAPLDPTKNFSPFVVVSFWGTNTVAMLRTQDAQNPLALYSESTPLPALPRSVLLHNFGTGKNSKEEDFQPYVLAGLTDGSVVALSFKNNELKDQKVFSLGTAPVSLSVCKVDGKRTVFASGSRSSVFFWDKQRLRHSPVMVKNIVGGSSLNTNHFPSCQILATPSSLVIGQIRGVDKMQIRSIPLGYDNPCRIAYHPSLNVFGVAVLRVTPNRVGETERKDSAFYLYDSITFNRIGQFVMDAEEEIVSVHALPPSDKGRPGAFIIGTVIYLHAEVEPSHGRLILFDVETKGSERELKVVATQQANGCVYALDSIGDCIVAAVNTEVDLYTVVKHDEDTSLTRVARWNHNYFVTSLAITGNTIAVGDAISSVALLEIEPPNNLKTVARDYSPLWPVTIGATKEGGIVGANNDCNLFTYTLQESETTKRLERSGFFHLGEMVTKFAAGGLSTHDTTAAAGADGPMFETEHVFFTTSGRIALVHNVSHAVALRLTAVQRNMAEMIVGPGETNHSKWRTPIGVRGRSDADSGPVGFLDGDFLEQFLTADDPEKLLQGGSEALRIRIPVEEIEDALEKLQSLH